MVIHVDRGLRPRVTDPAHVLRQGAHDQILGLVMLLVAVVLLVMPLATQTGPKDAQMNEMLVGLVVAFTAGRRIYRGGGVLSDLVVGLAGAWLIVSPFVLDLQNTAVHTVDRTLAFAAGGVLVVASLLSLLVWRMDRSRRTDQPAPRTTADSTADRTAAAPATRPSTEATRRRRRQA
ncbi:SPW repeat domain-containing protein [Streptomyces tritici]|uniref:SPW repeat domain-containing protein n=1 Tax=Streptomyces tritici TaxID=2054410 RepID=UPI003AEF262D